MTVYIKAQDGSIIAFGPGMQLTVDSNYEGTYGVYVVAGREWIPIANSLSMEDANEIMEAFWREVISTATNFDAGWWVEALKNDEGE